MKKTFKVIIYTALVILALCLVPYLYFLINVEEEEITEGSMLNISIGEDKVEVFRKISIEMSEENVIGFAHEKKENFLASKPNAKLINDPRVKEEEGYMYIRINKMIFSEYELKDLSYFDNWVFSWGENFSKSISFEFEDGKLSRIRRVAFLFWDK